MSILSYEKIFGDSGSFALLAKNNTEMVLQFGEKCDIIIDRKIVCWFTSGKIIREIQTIDELADDIIENLQSALESFIELKQQLN